MDDGPIALGATADVWECTYRDEKVSVKRLKIGTENSQTIRQVRSWYSAPSSCLLKNTAVVLQRGHHLEKIKTPEHRPFHRCYDGSFADHLGVDAKWKSDRVRREISRCESDQPGEFPSITALDQ